MVNIFLKAFVISLFLFAIGIAVGIGIEQVNTFGFAVKTSSIEDSIQQIELEMLYFQTLNSSNSCDFLNSVLVKTNNNLDLLSGQLEKYSDKNVIFSENVLDVKAKYSNLLIKSWLLQEKIKSMCNSQVTTILYFYNPLNCGDCQVQGNVLSVLKNSFKERLMVYPLDVRLDVDMIKILMNRYNTTSL